MHFYIYYYAILENLSMSTNDSDANSDGSLILFADISSASEDDVNDEEYEDER